MKNIALGQFYPADSYLHKLDPRFKIVIAILYIVCAFVCTSLISYLMLALSACIIVLISRIPFKVVLKSLKAIFFILIFTVIVNIFFTSGEYLLFEWKFIKIYREGILNAFYMIIRIMALIIGSSMFLTYTTTPIALTDGIEQLFAPLKKINLPVHEFAMMMTIALRFIPTLLEETERIVSAQKARGADFSTGSLIERAKAMIPILIPLFVSAFRRADELATAMECRCYHGGEGRTRMNILKSSTLDIVSLGIIIAFGVMLFALNNFSIIGV